MQSKASNYSNKTIHGYIAMHSKRRGSQTNEYKILGVTKLH